MEQLSTKGKKKIFDGRGEASHCCLYVAVPEVEQAREIYLKLDYEGCGYLYQYSLKDDKGFFLLTVREQYDIDPHLVRNHKIFTFIAEESPVDAIAPTGAINYMIGKIQEKLEHEKVQVNFQQLETTLRNALV